MQGPHIAESGSRRECQPGQTRRCCSRRGHRDCFDLIGCHRAFKTGTRQAASGTSGEGNISVQPPEHEGRGGELRAGAGPGAGLPWDRKGRSVVRGPSPGWEWSGPGGAGGRKQELWGLAPVMPVMPRPFSLASWACIMDHHLHLFASCPPPPRVDGNAATLPACPAPSLRDPAQCPVCVTAAACCP